MAWMQLRRDFHRVCRLNISLAKEGFAAFVSEYEKSFKDIKLGEGAPARWRSPSQVVVAYKDLCITCLLFAGYALMDGRQDDSIEKIGASIAAGFLKLGDVSALEWKRFGRKPERDFTYISLVVRSTFKRNAFKDKPKISALKERLSEKKYRWKVVARVLWMVNEFIESLAHDVKFVEQQVMRIEK